MKKVVIITRNMSAGGAERVISQLVKHLSGCHVKCYIIKLNEGEVFYRLPPDSIVISIGVKSHNKAINKLKQYIEIRKLVKSFKPDIVLAMPEEVGIYVIPALFGTRIPVIVSERNDPRIMPWKKVSRLARRIFYPFATGFVFQTEQAANFFPTNIIKKGIVLPNPLDLDRIPEPWEGDRRKEIVAAGRLDKQKNFPLLIQAFRKFNIDHSGYVLKIYGDGPMKQELESFAASLLPEKTYVFPGRDVELLTSICGAAMFVLSSDYEGMPNVVIEAMAMGMPVISTDCPSGGSAELIESGKNGLLVPVGDVDALWMAMSKVAESKELAINLGENARKIKKRLDSNVVSESWRNYLNECIKS